MRVTLGFLALACAMGVTTHAAAALVYSDTMTGTGLLNGSAPDTVNVPAATWFANDGTSDLLEDAFVRGATGTTVGLDGMEGAGAEGSAATLPITLSPGNTYTASVTVEPIEGGNWMYLSFVNTAAYNVDLNGGGDGTDQPRALALVVTNGDFHSYAPFATGVSAYEGDLGTGPGGTFPRELGIVIDVAPDGSATVDYYNDGVLHARPQVTLSAAAVSEIQGVTIGRLTAAGTFSNFSLDVTSAVPEPSSLVLASFVVLGGAVTYYRRRSGQIHV